MTELVVGQIVWAKIKGFSWWPGKISSIKDNKIYDINFFGDNNSHACIKRSLVVDFKEKYSQYSKVKTKNLIEAIKEAKKILNMENESEKLSEDYEKEYESDSGEKMKTVTNLEFSETKNEEEKSECNDLKNMGPRMELDHLLLMSSFDDETEEDDDSTIFLSKKRLKTRDYNEENILQEELFYLDCIAAEFKSEKKKKLKNEEKTCLIGIFGNLQNFPLKDVLSFLEKTKAHSYVSYLLSKITDKDIQLYGTATIKYFEKLYLTHLKKKREQFN